MGRKTKAIAVILFAMLSAGCFTRAACNAGLRQERITELDLAWTYEDRLGVRYVTQVRRVKFGYWREYETLREETRRAEISIGSLCRGTETRCDRTEDWREIHDPHSQDNETSRRNLPVVTITGRPGEPLTDLVTPALASPAAGGSCEILAQQCRYPVYGRGCDIAPESRFLIRNCDGETTLAILPELPHYNLPYRRPWGYGATVVLLPLALAGDLATSPLQLLRAATPGPLSGVH